MSAHELVFVTAKIRRTMYVLCARAQNLDQLQWRKTAPIFKTIVCVILVQIFYNVTCPT